MPIHGLAAGVNKKFSNHYGVVSGVNKQFKSIYGVAGGVNKEVYTKLTTYEKYTKGYTRSDTYEEDIFISYSDTKDVDIYKLTGVPSYSSIPILFDGDEAYYDVSGYKPTLAEYQSVPYSSDSVLERWMYTINGVKCAKLIFSTVRSRSSDNDSWNYEIYANGYRLEITWAKGTLVGTVEAVDGTYPENGLHTDDYWYVKIG